MHLELEMFFSYFEFQMHLDVSSWLLPWGPLHPSTERRRLAHADAARQRAQGLAVLSALPRVVLEEASTWPRQGAAGGGTGEHGEEPASPALAGTSAACPVARRVGVGPRAEGIMAVLTAVGTQLSGVMPLEGLNAFERRHLSLHVAATAILKACDDDEALTPWLAHALTFLAPLPSAREAYNATLRGVAARVLDQPPGEVERICEGLCRGQAPRLHRAWRRGFFVPSSFDLEKWVAQTVR